MAKNLDIEDLIEKNIIKPLKIGKKHFKF